MNKINFPYLEKLNIRLDSIALDQDSEIIERLAKIGKIFPNIKKIKYYLEYELTSEISSLFNKSLLSS